MKEKDYSYITYNLTMEAAKTLSRLNPDMTFCYVSGLGTDGSEKGKLAWARVKGKTENDLMKLSFKSAFMFRPGFIKPIKGLKHAHAFYKPFVPFFPLLIKLFPGYVCTLEDVGNSMIDVTLKGYYKKIIENENIIIIAKRFRGENT